jgi:TetR/AcrR family transcriptional repressor of mexJK operon
VAKKAGPGRPPKNIDKILLECAYKEFADKGFNDASLDAIVAAAGITKPTLYRRYKSKVELFEATATRLMDEINGPSPEPDRTAPVAEVLYQQALLFDRRQRTPRSIAMMRLLVTESRRFPALARRVRTHSFTSYMAPFVAYLEWLNTTGQLEIPDTLEAAITFTTLAGGGFRRLLGVKIAEAEQQVRLRELVRFFMAGYAPRTPPAPPP